MKIIVFGSASATGHLLVGQALDFGHTVTAFIRSRQQLNISHPGLYVYEGDVMQFHNVLPSIQGQGMVMAARLTGAHHIVRAMHMCGVERFIGLAGYFIGKNERCIRASSLLWTIVRPGALTNGRITGRYRHGAVPRFMISRADVALFMLMQITCNDYIHQTPSLSY
jgi:Putative NADH-flavin reductase